jgi:hypothetical protein
MEFSSTIFNKSNALVPVQVTRIILASQESTITYLLQFNSNGECSGVMIFDCSHCFLERS